MFGSGSSSVELRTTTALAFEHSFNSSMLLNMDAHVETVTLRLGSAVVPFTEDVLLTRAEVLVQMFLGRVGQYELLKEGLSRARLTKRSLLASSPSKVLLQPAH